MLEHQDPTRKILGGFYRVYDGPGFGHPEAVYGTALEMELREMGLHLWREAPIEVWYRGCTIGRYRADFLVDGKVVLELRSTHTVDDSARRQLYN